MPLVGEGGRGVVASDPNRGYANAVGVHLGPATLVVDHFQMVKFANAVINDVRRRVQADRQQRRGGDPNGEVLAAWRSREHPRPVARVLLCGQPRRSSTCSAAEGDDSSTCSKRNSAPSQVHHTRRLKKSDE